jgi:acetyl-CoA carboxylase carboxyl transferase subunit beta
MNWLTNFVKPKMRSLVKKKEVPDDMWVKCKACEQMLFTKELERALKVCPHCNHHMRLSAKERLELLMDDGLYEVIPLKLRSIDPLKFKDTQKYTERLKDAKQKTKLDEAIVVASGKIRGTPAVMAVFDFAFMGGSMSMMVGDGLVKASEIAIQKKCPLIVIPASGGARMQEGVLSLMQMPRSVIAVERVKEQGLPYIVLLTDPTTGGVSASFAMLGDIALAEPGAIIGFTGRRVIEQTIKGQLPANFQKAEYLLEHGMVDQVIPRNQLKEKIGTLLQLLMNKKI